MHYPGHLREAFIAWIDAGFPPTTEVEVNYEPERWDAARLLRKMARCSDILPRDAFDELDERFGLEGVAHTYGAVSRRLLRNRATGERLESTTPIKPSREAYAAVERMYQRPPKDDAEAAERYRLAQAEELIRQLRRVQRIA